MADGDGALRYAAADMPSGVIKRLFHWIGRIGADQHDSIEVALQKRLVLGLTLVPAPAGTAWGIMYALAGAPLSGLIPAAYSVVAVANTVLFARTRNLELYRFSQLALILVLPWLLMLSLGGFADGSAVIIWSALCPLAALMLDRPRRAIGWIFGFVALLLISGLAQPYLPAGQLPERVAAWLFVLNLGVVIAIAFGMLF